MTMTTLVYAATSIAIGLGLGIGLGMIVHAVRDGSGAVQAWLNTPQPPVRIATSVADRLEEIRQSIRDESLSWGELADLQGLAAYIDPSDLELLEWAGASEVRPDLCPL